MADKDNGTVMYPDEYKKLIELVRDLNTWVIKAGIAVGCDLLKEPEEDQAIDIEEAVAIMNEVKKDGKVKAELVPATEEDMKWEFDKLQAERLKLESSIDSINEEIGAKAVPQDAFVWSEEQIQQRVRFAKRAEAVRQLKEVTRRMHDIQDYVVKLRLKE